MKIAIDTNDLPAATRIATWRGMLCDTYLGVDCRVAEDFRCVIEGHAVGEHTLTRITSTRNAITRTRSLIQRDGLELIFFGFLLAGHAVTLQGGREVALERGAVVVSDTSRPFETHVDKAADIVWLSTPRKPIAARTRGIEDLVAMSFRPARPVEKIALDLMAGFDDVLSQDVPAHDAERLTTHVMDLLAMILTSAGLPPRAAAWGLLQ